MPVGGFNAKARFAFGQVAEADPIPTEPLPPRPRPDPGLPVPGQTDLEIANLALLDLGQPLLATEQDDSKAGRIFRASFEITVREILRTHPWRCCRAQTILVPDPDNKPPFGFAHSHVLPYDFVKVVKFQQHIDKFEVVGRHLQCDSEAPYLTYVARKATPYFDDLLVSSIGARCAWRWCLPLTDNATAVEAYKKTFSEIFADAKFADALDGAQEEPPIGTWAQARISEF